jgi:hypothetical protein
MKIITLGQSERLEMDVTQTILKIFDDLQAVVLRAADLILLLSTCLLIIRKRHKKSGRSSRQGRSIPNRTRQLKVRQDIPRIQTSNSEDDITKMI